MDIQWTPQQRAALDKVYRWLEDPNGQQVFRLFGYAGTGKSTLARAVDEHLGFRSEKCAYTGKAASVMARKGLAGARTVHSLIYTPAGSDQTHLDELKRELGLLNNIKEPSPTVLQRKEAVERSIREAEARGGRPLFLLKEQSDITGAPLVILDECSMVDERMGQDLLSFGVKVLALGDPAQLPPVQGAGYFTKGARPDVLLTDVRRNAGPILRLATAIREGRDFSPGEWRTEESTVRIVNRRGLDPQLPLLADQLLCGTNGLRQACNRRHRVLKGFDNSPMPLEGERLMCLKNDREVGLLNGTQWIAAADAVWPDEGSEVFLRITPEEGGVELGIPAESCIFLNEADKPQWGRAQQFTFGYCATTHRAQGSEWGTVVLFNDWRFNNWREWAYTGVTRARQELTVVLM